MGAVMSSVTEPYGYTAKDNALIGGVFIVSGVIGTIVMSILLDRYHKFKLSLLVVALVGVLSLLAAQYTLPSRNVAMFAINTALIGFSGIPVGPIGNGLAVELTFPIAEAVSNGTLNMPNIIYGFISGILAGVLCLYSPRYTLIMFTINCALGGIAILFIKEELRRLKPKQPSEKPDDAPIIENARLNFQSTVVE